MTKLIVFSIITAIALQASSLNNVKDERNSAERGAFFYEFDESDNPEETKQSKATSTRTSKPTNNKDGKAIAILEELLKVAKEQKEIQQKILEIISEEVNPTPKTVVIDGKECIANSSADCFVMPLTTEAKKIPVIKELISNPTPETAKNYLQWQAKYLATGPFKVGRSFQYAVNTWGEEAYPMNITRGSVNTNTNDVEKKRASQRQELLNAMYEKETLGIYIFLQSGSLDYFSLKQISEISDGASTKKAITLVFKNQTDKDNIFSSLDNKYLKEKLEKASVLISEEIFKSNNIYMTPTYTAVSRQGEEQKKQAVAIGRVDVDELNFKIYEWLEQESVIERGGLSDYKVWKDNGDKK